MRGIAEASPRSTARIAGLFELLEAVTSGFGQVIVPRMLVVSGNAAATAANIVTHAGLFHVSIAAGIIGAACHSYTRSRSFSSD
jgi:presenilin-like A22 family membrane protease